MDKVVRKYFLEETPVRGEVVLKTFILIISPWAISVPGKKEKVQRPTPK